MDAIQFLKAELDSGEFLLTRGVEDLAGSEFYQRLPNAGESADWIFGHIAVNEDWFLSILTGSAVKAPRSFAMFTSTTSLRPASARRCGLARR